MKLKTKMHGSQRLCYETTCKMFLFESISCSVDWSRCARSWWVQRICVFRIRPSVFCETPSRADIRLVLVSEIPHIMPRNITSCSGVNTVRGRPRSLGCTLNVPFSLSRLPMAKKFFRSGIWRCGKSCFTFSVISSTKHQTHVGHLSINALMHYSNVTLGMEQTNLAVAAALLLCHCESQSEASHTLTLRNAGSFTCSVHFCCLNISKIWISQTFNKTS